MQLPLSLETSGDLRRNGRCRNAGEESESGGPKMTEDSGFQPQTTLPLEWEDNHENHETLRTDCDECGEEFSYYLAWYRQEQEAIELRELMVNDRELMQDEFHIIHGMEVNRG